MTSYQPDKAADALHEARLRRTQIAPLAAAVAPRTEAEGAAVQFAMAQRAGAASPAGFKIGATARRMQEYLGLSGPAAGFMAAGNLYRSGATCTFRRLSPSRCGMRTGRASRPRPSTRSLHAGAGRRRGRRPGRRHRDRREPLRRTGEFGTPTLIADQVFHAAAVLGEPGIQGWHSLDVATLHGRLIVDGHTRDEGVGADLMGHPLNCLAWLAGSSVAAAFGGLRAGQVVMLGSVTPPIWLTGPASVTVDFAPLPPVQVRLD